jgi:hypothetical protein
MKRGHVWVEDAYLYKKTVVVQNKSNLLLKIFCETLALLAITFTTTLMVVKSNSVPAFVTSVSYEWKNLKTLAPGMCSISFKRVEYTEDRGWLVEQKLIPGSAKANMREPKSCLG